MPEETKYPFTILDETVAEEDVYDGKTHDALAETLAGIIRDGKKGLTIGLEGEWGSGKSTIVNLLQKKLEKCDTHVCVFDAWAHEKEEVRTAFLDTFLSSILRLQKIQSDAKVPIKALQDGLRNPKTKSTTESEYRWQSSFAVLVALLTMSLPAVLGFMTTVKKDDFPSWYIFFFAMAVAPVVLVIGRFLLTPFFGRMPLSDYFPQSTPTVTTTTTLTPEQSGAEFERVFAGAISALHCHCHRLTHVVVIDNLDRVDAVKAKQIISALSIYLRNSTENKKYMDQVWFIIPYARTEMNKLWKTDDVTSASGTLKMDVAESFLQKMMQVRLHVPAVSLFDWCKFLGNQMEIAIGGWTPEDKKIIIDSIAEHYMEKENALTPRMIKSYLNQVATLRTLADKAKLNIVSQREAEGEAVSLKALCEFVLERYVDNKVIRVQEMKQEDRGKLSYEQQGHTMGDQKAALYYLKAPKNTKEHLLIDGFFNKSKMRTYGLGWNDIGALIEEYKHVAWLVLGMRMRRDRSYETNEWIISRLISHESLPKENINRLVKEQYNELMKEQYNELMKEYDVTQPLPYSIAEKLSFYVRALRHCEIELLPKFTFEFNGFETTEIEIIQKRKVQLDAIISLKEDKNERVPMVGLSQHGYSTYLSLVGLNINIDLCKHFSLPEECIPWERIKNGNLDPMEMTVLCESGAIDNETASGVAIAQLESERKSLLETSILLLKGLASERLLQLIQQKELYEKVSARSGELKRNFHIFVMHYHAVKNNPAFMLPGAAEEARNEVIAEMSRPHNELISRSFASDEVAMFRRFGAFDGMFEIAENIPYFDDFCKAGFFALDGAGGAYLVAKKQWEEGKS